MRKRWSLICFAAGAVCAVLTSGPNAVSAAKKPKRTKIVRKAAASAAGKVVRRPYYGHYHPQVQAEIQAERVAHANRWVGTQFSPALGAKGDVLSLQQAACAAVNALDAKPPERMAHFQWIAQYKQFPVNINGWFGIVTNVVPDPEGYFVTFRVGPHVSSTERGGVLYTSDHHFETWLFDPMRNRLLFVKSTPPDRDYSGSFMKD
jgi:hypothetical protein